MLHTPGPMPCSALTWILWPQISWPVAQLGSTPQKTKCHLKKKKIISGADLLPRTDSTKQEVIRNTNPNSQNRHQRRPSVTEYSSRRWLLDSFHNIPFCERFLLWPIFKNRPPQAETATLPSMYQNIMQQTATNTAFFQKPHQYSNPRSPCGRSYSICRVFSSLPLTKGTKCNSTRKGEMKMVPSYQIVTNVCLNIPTADNWHTMLLAFQWMGSCPAQNRQHRKCNPLFLGTTSSVFPPAFAHAFVLYHQ